MASGTQGYTTTSGPIEPKKIADKAKKTAKDIHSAVNRGFRILKGLQNDDVQEVAVSVYEPQAAMITGVADNLLTPSSIQALPSADELIEADPQEGITTVLVRIAEDIAVQNQLIGSQIKLLESSIGIQRKALADDKRLRRESRLERGVDLSGNPDIVNRKKLGQGGNALSNFINGLDAVTDVLDIVSDARRGRRFWRNFRKGNRVNDLTNVRRLNQANNIRDGARGTNWFSNLFRRNGSTTNIGRSNLRVTPKSELLKDTFRASDAVVDTNVVSRASDLKPKGNLWKNITNAVSNNKQINQFTNMMGNIRMPSRPNWMKKGLSMPNLGLGKKFNTLMPGLSGASAISSFASGDPVSGVLDTADFVGDVSLVKGSASGAQGVLGPTIAVTSSMMISKWAGEMTRGTDDWIKGDGKNIARNALGNLTATVSGVLETIGTPLTGLIEGGKSLWAGKGFSQSNARMAETDANIRESLRKGFNALDLFGIVSDEKGSWGTLSWYGKENVDNANMKLLMDKGVPWEDWPEEMQTKYKEENDGATWAAPSDIINENTENNDEVTNNNIETVNKGDENIVTNQSEVTGDSTKEITNIVNNNKEENNNVTTTTNKIEGGTKISEAIRSTVLNGGTSGDPALDQKIINNHFVETLEAQLASAPEGKKEEITKMIKGIEDGTITPSLGQELISSNNVTDNITKPDTTPRTALGNQVARAPDQTPIIINNTSQQGEQNNEQGVPDASWAMSLEDAATSHLKNLTFMRLASA
tara:strand:+ start:4782 stop:7061 length:2280 start_codon:yes stop_codon:yes gene_type:complete